jgi:multidrug efflux system membrane fusion protein
MKKYLILFASLTLLGCSSNAPSQQQFTPPAVPVRTAEVVMRNMPLYFEEMGVVASSCSVDVIPQVQGQITQMHFEEGAQVVEGDLLYTIDQGPYDIKVKEAEAQLMQNMANLENVQKRMDRYKSLTKQDLISKVEWDELATQITLAEAMVKADEARLAAAQRDLEHCKVKAPISGKAGKTSLHPGNLVASGIALLKLVQEDSLVIDFSLTEKELRKLPESNPRVEVYAAGEQDCIAKGEVVFLDHTLDTKTGMIAARARITETHKPLLVGQAVRLHLFFGERENAKLIPLKAIKTNQSGPYVFAVKEDNLVEIRSLKLGPEDKGMIVVEDGLEGVSKIVTEGHLRLFPGIKVEEAAQ